MTYLRSDENYMGMFKHLGLRLSITFLLLTAGQFTFAVGPTVPINCTNVATDAAKLIEIDFPTTNGIQESSLKRPQVIGVGGYHEATRVQLNGKDYIYIRSKHADDIAHLTEAESQEVAKLTPKSAKPFAYSALFDEPVSKTGKGHTYFEAVRDQAAADILDFEYYKKIKNLKYGDHTIAPEVYDIVRDKHGIPTGLLMEELPGATLASYKKSNQLSIEELQSIDKQVREQLAILHKAGYVHGDPAPRNVMISFENGKPVARLIDFTAAAEQHYKSISNSTTRKGIYHEENISWHKEFTYGMNREQYLWFPRPTPKPFYQPVLDFFRLGDDSL